MPPSSHTRRSRRTAVRVFVLLFVVMVLEPLRREVPGRMVLIWDGAPIHRSHRIQECLSHGAAPRLHLERLPAYAPELNPGEGLWQQLTGVELRHVCCFHLPQLRRELREAVKRVRRQPSLIHGFFRGAKLSVFMHGSVGALLQGSDSCHHRFDSSHSLDGCILMLKRARQDCRDRNAGGRGAGAEESSSQIETDHTPILSS